PAPSSTATPRWPSCPPCPARSPSSSTRSGPSSSTAPRRAHGPACVSRERGGPAGPAVAPGGPAARTRDHPPGTLPAMPEELLLRTRALSVGYGQEPVRAPADLTLAPGEAVAVIGANGTGKSTVLRTVLGLQEPLGGRVELLGAPPDPRTGDQRAAVAAVLGDDAFFPALTVTEHLLLTALGHRVPDARDLVTDLVADFGLDDRADALPSALSSGQRRRV